MRIKRGMKMTNEQIEAIEFQVAYFNSLGDRNAVKTILTNHHEGKDVEDEYKWGTALDSVSYDELYVYFKSQNAI